MSHSDNNYDNFDKALHASPCIAENDALLNCKMTQKDWRKCVDEMKHFRECWAKNKPAAGI